jgi:DNA repair protein RecO (recombination protein O)
VIESGPIAVKPRPDRVQFRGKTLLDIVRDDYSDSVTIQETKQLMRMLINHYLGGQLLHTRQFIKDLRDF